MRFYDSSDGGAGVEFFGWGHGGWVGYVGAVMGERWRDKRRVRG